MAADGQAKAAGFLMGLTYAVGALGIGLGFSTAFSSDPDLRWAVFFAVGLAGILSWVRHSLLNRGDAQRMGWDSGEANPFQVELAVVAVALSWGLAVYSACFLVFGFYMAFVTVFKAIRSGSGHPEEWRTVIPAGSFAALLIVIGSAGMSALP
jgi:nucleotide-binding universal stress UspA family protein